MGDLLRLLSIKGGGSEINLVGFWRRASSEICPKYVLSLLDHATVTFQWVCFMLL